MGALRLTYQQEDTSLLPIHNPNMKVVYKREEDSQCCEGYYPFGMLMPGRNSNSGNYRYGMNGMEKDDEVKGNGNSYTTYFRQLDPRLGRWLSIDPKASSLPWQSPYCSMDNNPIWFNDPMGDKVKNKHKEKYDKAKNTKDVSQSKFDDLVNSHQGELKSKHLRQYRKTSGLKDAERAFKAIEKKFLETERAINDYKQFNPDAYEQLDNLTYYEGGKVIVDVYVGIVKDLKSKHPNSDGEYIKLDGRTDLLYNTRLKRVKEGTTYKAAYFEVYSEEYGPNIIVISIDAAGIDKGRTLSHEAGHAIYGTKNGIQYLRWMGENMGRSIGGHGGGNPSGLAADEAEKIYDLNKKKR